MANGHTNGFGIPKLSQSTVTWGLGIIGLAIIAFITLKVHTTDFEAQVNQRFEHIEQDIEKLENRVHPVELDLAAIKTELNHISDELSAINGKLDRLVN